MATSWASAAALNSLLKYAPQRSALKDLQQQAEEQAQSAIQAGKSESTLGVQAAQQAVAPTKQIFSQAQTEGERGRALTQPTLAALGSSSPFSVAAANSAAAGNERRANSQATALSDLQQRRVAAAELPAFTRSAAMATLLSELQKISGKGQSLLGQEAANTQAETDRSRKEAHKDSLTERGQNLSRASAEEGNRTRRQIAEEKGEGKGASKPLTRAQQDAGLSTFKSILSLAKTGVEHGEGRGQLVARLSKGRSHQSVGVNAKGEPIKEGEKAVQHVSIGSIPAYKPNSLMSAALDVAEHGHVSVGVQRQLQREGYDVPNLGLPLQSSAEYRRQRGTEKAVGSVGKKVSKALSGLG